MGSGFSTGGDAELGQDVRDVGFGGARADEECLSDLGVGASRDQEPENLALARVPPSPAETLEALFERGDRSQDQPSG